jgi:hypothetical protein
MLHACGQPVLGAGTWKEWVKISYKGFIVFHWVRPEAQITKSSAKCVHNSVLDATAYQSSVCRYLVYYGILMSSHVDDVLQHVHRQVSNAGFFGPCRR